MSELRRCNQRERVLRQARLCMKKGWAPLPVEPEGKAPRHNGWQKRLLRSDELGDAFGSKDNVGVLTGERNKKQVKIRGLNRNYNHDLKNLFKGAAIVAATKPGPFAEFYVELLARGMRPEMARLTLARKIATIVLIVWKRGVCFDAQHLKPQTA